MDFLDLWISGFGFLDFKVTILDFRMAILDFKVAILDFRVAILDFLPRGEIWFFT